MVSSQSAQLSKAEETHLRVIKMDSKYKETAHWTPVLIPRSKLQEIDRELVQWLTDRKLERGTPKARNDYLCPTTGFFLFKDPKIAVEFKLTWG